ncbi:NAD(P)H-binding protein [Streptomyces sp. SID3343]|uniref:NAD(P)H-binding protein n=1 Tax=Streptomyces sp. SID3343 TaxID=2690260 RepID=UPI001369538F|nr:NAD(P)H-binding protein [Streptomyces sp. SID3343]MYW05908.1 NAD(P)H-binding protein [Streptomyces sp. SID3343]
MILVTGSTGNVGSEVVRALVAAGEPVRALVRDTLRPMPAQVEAVIGDLDSPESLVAALEGVHGVFLLPGYRDMPGVLARIRRAGVERVVLLSGGSVEAGDQGNAVTRYMVASEEAVRQSGVAWTILRPTGFMANALRWLPQLRAGDVVRGAWPDVAIAAIDPYDIASVAARALLESGHAGRVYPLSGPEPLVPADQVRILADVLGREKLRFEGLSNDEARAELLASGTPKEYVDAFYGFYAEGTLDESRVLPTVRTITGREPRTFRRWAEEHAGDLR